MQSKEYQAAAVATESNDYYAIRDRLASMNTIRLLHGALGVVTESAEFADVLKKYIFYGREIDKCNLSEEVGDLFWYCAIIADALGEDFPEIMQRNIDKLRERYGDKFSESAALNRDLNAERTILETREVAKHAPEVEDVSVMWCDRLPGKVDAIGGACPIHDGDACLQTNLQEDDERPEGREGT